MEKQKETVKEKIESITGETIEDMGLEDELEEEELEEIIKRSDKKT
ncbi:MAG: hypothetical protein ACTSR2_01045 [Candidatus Hodarchaeales archaeon]